MGGMDEEWWLNFGKDKRFYFSLKPADKTWGPPCLLIIAGSDADPPTCNADVKNEWRYSFTFPSSFATCKGINFLDFSLLVVT
jgi:hypothetical protein